MSDHIQFAEFFNARLKEHGVALKRLSEITGIALKHLENLSAGQLDGLPPAPYLRGYLRKLGSVLNFDGDEWWELLKKEQELMQSGPKDTLPENRFLDRPVRTYVWILGVFLLILVYAGIRLPSIIGSPELTVFFPAQSFIEVHTARIVIQGQVQKGTSVLINREPIPLEEESGLWQKEITLQEGLNTIEVRAKKFLGQDIAVVRQIHYTPAPEGLLPQSPATPQVP